MSVEYPLSTPSSDERTLAVLAHVLAIVPGIGIFGPLVIYLIRRDGPAFVTENAKESLNFQLTLLICYVIAWILCVVLIGFVLFGDLVVRGAGIGGYRSRAGKRKQDLPVSF